MTNTRDRPRSAPHPDFRVKKARIKFFMIDNVVIDEYAPKIGPYALSVYCWIVREAHRETSAVKGKYHQDIADALNISRRQVIRSIKILAGEDGTAERSPTLSQPLIGVERMKTSRSKVPNKPGTYIVLSTEGYDSQSQGGVPDSHTPMPDSHSGMTDMHTPVPDSHSGVSDGHTYKDQDYSKRPKTLDQEGDIPLSQAQNGDAQNGGTTTPPPPPSPDNEDAQARANGLADFMQATDKTRRSRR